MTGLPPSRRRALSMAAGLLTSSIVSRTAAAAPSPALPGATIPGTSAAQTSFPEGPALVVAGPPQGRLDHWADLLIPALARVFPSAFAGLATQPVARSAVGGADGVTGANQFEAHVPPDGGTALLLPGSAAIAWLVGDPRAQFDAARWVPAWAGLASAVLVSRVPLTPGRTLRVGGVHPAGLTLPALLTLDMLGIEVTPSADNVADAVFHCGQGARMAAAAQHDMTPVMTLGTVDATGAWLRDPAFATVPTAIEIAARQSPPPAMLAALRATAAAAILDVALVLPQLSPANRVAMWRRACAEASVTPGLLSEAASLGVRAAPAAASATLTRAIAADVPTLLALRTWLDARWGWRPA
jgi:hypothetical protein